MIPVIAAALLLAGCAPHAVNTNTTAPAIAPEPSVYGGAAGGRIGILVPEILLYDVSAGGIFEYRDDWSAGASKSVMVSAAVKLVNYGYDVKVLPDAGRTRNFMRLKTKMRYHASAFQSAFFAGGAGAVPPIDSLAYSLGPQDTLCGMYGVDAFLYIYGYEEKFSKERRRIVGAGSAERTFMAAILVERGGRVAWYRHLMVSGNLDMREERHAMRMIGAIFD